MQRERKANVDRRQYEASHMFVQYNLEQISLTEVLPSSDDVHLAFGELTWSYGVLSASATTTMRVQLRSASAKHAVLSYG